MLSRTEVALSGSVSTDESRDDRTYEPPAFEELGSFTELTQGRRGNPFFFDCFGTSAV